MEGYTRGPGLGDLRPFFLELAVKFALAPVKHRYLRHNWLDVLVLPFLKFRSWRGFCGWVTLCRCCGS